ncbi:hypothetical protein K502DRAFT_326648 [Neoconidiobolus thromboides FSU 785]|nr:hypothetical protein K502DRAFT_326648 [Neoconidiobolus thromboides FSU 785]
MTTEEYIFAHEINIKEIFQNLQYLELDNLDNYFKTTIIPYLPSTITSLIVKYNYDNEVPYFQDLLNKFDNLKVLELIGIYIKPEEFDYLLNKEFPQLKRLHIQYVEVDNLDEVIINLGNYPKLKVLYYHRYTTLVFNGVSNLRELILNDVKLSKTVINDGIFPKLNQIRIEYCYNLSTKHLHSIFNMPTVTSLNLMIYNNPSFLIKEVYPKKSCNLIKLSITSFTLGNDFFTFLYTLCPKLHNLEISDCDFDFGPSPIASKNELTLNHGLTNVMFYNYYDLNSEIFIEYILKHYKNLKSFHITNTGDYLEKYMDEYSSIFNKYV